MWFLASVWLLIAILVPVLMYLLREQQRLNAEINRMRVTIHRVDDHLDQLGLVFNDLAEAPSAGDLERAEVGLISLMDDLMRYQEV